VLRSKRIASLIPVFQVADAALGLLGFGVGPRCSSAFGGKPVSLDREQVVASACVAAIMVTVLGVLWYAGTLI